MSNFASKHVPTGELAFNYVPYNSNENPEMVTSKMPTSTNREDLDFNQKKRDFVRPDEITINKNN